jgi:hypothetical protein
MDVGANLVFALFTSPEIPAYCHKGEHKVRPYILIFYCMPCPDAVT